MDSSAAADYLTQTLTPSSSPSSDPPPPSLGKSSSFSKLNAQAPAFVPRTTSSSGAVSSSSSPLLSPSASSSDLGAGFVIPRPPALVHVYNTGAYGYSSPPLPSGVQFYNGRGGGGLVDHRQLQQRQELSALTPPSLAPLPVAQVNSETVVAPGPLRNGIPEETAQKIINQVEFYFSDVNLATTGFLFKIMIKDPEGYVPISVVASIKKIKTFSKSHSELASVLQNSSKLVVSDDGKKLKRQSILTESDMEEVQSRIIIAENLPEDHCHQNLMKIFSAVGSVKSIRTCQPNGQSSISKTAKVDGVNFSNKLHAFVEYESSELAEKAVAELNEGNWRNGLKVRLLLKGLTKSAQARVKRVGHEGESFVKEEDAFAQEQQQINELEDSVQLMNEPVWEEHTHEKDGGPRKGRSRESREISENRGVRKGQGQGQGRGRASHNYNNRGNHGGVTSNIPINVEQPNVAKQPPGPRMPDGTRGFSMGRGKPLALQTS